MSIGATRDLVAGEEIFVSYNYALEKAPEWYQVLQPCIKMIFVRYLRVVSFAFKVFLHRQSGLLI